MKEIENAKTRKICPERNSEYWIFFTPIHSDVGVDGAAKLVRVAMDDDLDDVRTWYRDKQAVQNIEHGLSIGRTTG